MSNPKGRDPDATGPDGPVEKAPAEARGEDDEATGIDPTEVMSKQRRFTAPSNFDAGSTEIIEPTPEPATEVFSAPTEPNAVSGGPSRTATPQSIPARPGVGRAPMRRYRSWGWVLALILVIAALAAVAIMGTVWLTHAAAPPKSQEDIVRRTLQNFDAAVQQGDLAALRSITCGTTRDSYVGYEGRA